MAVPDDPQGIPQRPVVLAVDDLPANLAVASVMLEALDVDIRLAENGQSALAQAEATPQPDLILLDVMMPGMDGHAVLARLRANPATRQIPVIFVTALNSPSDEQSGLLEGAVDYITKPLQAAVFRARVRNHLDLKLARDQLTRQNAGLEHEVRRRLAENQQLATRLQLTLSASGLGIWEYHHASARIEWNGDLCRMLGLDSSPTTLVESFAYIHPEDRARIEAAMRNPPAPGGEIAVEEFRMRHADGRWLWVEGRGQALHLDPGGAPALTAGTIADISRRKQIDIERQLSSVVFTGISDGICITDPDCRILTVNQAFLRVTGYSAGEVIGRTPALLKSGQHGQAFYQAMWETLKRQDSWQGEITNRRKNGERVTEWLSISAVRDPGGRLTHYVGLFSDLSERQQAAERIQYLSSFDPLTDLPNRSLLTDRLDQALINAHRFERQTAVILLDLDRFRVVNENFGAPVGDALLQEISRRLKQLVRDGDTVGRRSGTEFGFVMANLGHESDVLALTQRLLESIAVPFEVEGQSLALTASIGISLAPRDGSRADELLGCADIALARAKQAGRNTFRFYAPEMNADAARRLGLESALRDALKNGELDVHYQPQVSLDSGRVIGMEALLRWHSPQFGTVSPGEFIPLAEDNGMILAIGEWVLATACRQARRWHDLGLGAPLRLAVNLSARQFRQANLEQLVARCLADSGLPASALELEITESAFIDDVDEAIAMCRKLKQLGVKLSLDDFGTGYSSLSYVSRFPFDKIKIDQSFVRDIIENPVNAAIATSAIVMARSLNLAILAEGVETEAQARFLRGRRCDAIQGFLFSPALPAAAFEQLLAGRTTLPIADLPSAGKQTLLIVDDEPNILNALTRLLRREGFQILNATSPREAFEHLAKQPVQVVLSDQRMPEMSGTEFLARVRQLYPESIRIILTGYTDVDSITGAINRGAIYKFLTKPWDDDQLREEIRDAFRLAKETRPQPPAEDS
ncbi:PAS domain S-box-containing protein/diguanylate cyclase (GGDEF)-like protein [Azonexus fungiphilus]|uniref:PAS domain S-box-containing protein/diguanylate cyclase (GGDEF)-like protein n=1 Tax=Azonexus fungiphilus TaxID=146940 RepID=A0A495WBW6_9RHOO|nr:EAL domain-containing protein [Azonexus fungiphilus]RKT58654.1 PAS domain S-box-containing protein/diguanylate cyclase (GGDEF)-like protein [Azonexus fungiphilus]